MTFNECYSIIQPHTVVDRERCVHLWTLSQSVKNLEGEVAELGVYKGGTSLLLKHSLPHKEIHSFDTFEGLPNCNAVMDGSVHHNGDFAVPDQKQQIISNLTDAGIILHVGLFPHTAQSLDKKFCFAHFDGDTYQSCKDFLDYFWPRMVPDGVMMFDDCDWIHTLGVRTALNEFSKSENVTVAKTTATQAVVIRNDRFVQL